MDLLCLGTPVIDMFARVKDADLERLGLPKGATSHLMPAGFARLRKKLGKKITYRYPGDNARNVCEGFAALGGFCGFAGAVGSDRAAGEFEASLAECGIGNFLQEKKGSTGKILALVTPDGQRTFAADLGVSSECDEFDSLALSESRMLYLASISLLVKPIGKLATRYLEAAKKGRIRIAISLESPPMVEKNRKKLLAVVKKYADILFLNEDEAKAFLGSGRGVHGKGQVEKKLALLKPSALAYLKRGPKGSVVFHRGKKSAVLPLPAKMIDSTGAGDAYAAGVLYGLSRGYSPSSSGKMGCYLATKVVQKFGAGIPLRHTRLRIRHSR